MRVCVCVCVHVCMCRMCVRVYRACVHVRVCAHNQLPAAEIGVDCNVCIGTKYVSFSGTEDTRVTFSSPCASDAANEALRKLRSTTAM